MDWVRECRSKEVGSMRETVSELQEILEVPIRVATVVVLDGFSYEP